VLGRRQRVVEIDLNALEDFLAGGDKFDEMSPAESAQEVLPF
jgi:hypothetical protein